jgi:hypothetical protein
MAPKAKLMIVLKADETIVAEAENPELWQRILGILNRGDASKSKPQPSDDELDVLDAGDHGGAGKKAASSSRPVARFATSLGVSEDELVAALDPKLEPPYLHLDLHCWAAMKKGTPQRGPGGLPPTGLAGTLLALWFKQAGIDLPSTQALASDVLKTVNVVDKNPSRGIKNTKWLQARSGGAIVINAAEIAKAQEIARAFCTKKWGGKASGT